VRPILVLKTARRICPQDVMVVPVQPPPGCVIAATWRHGNHYPLLQRLLGFVRNYHHTNTRPANAPRLSPRAQTSIGRLPCRPGFLGLANA
jgi:hypothetical protein